MNLFLHLQGRFGVAAGMEVEVGWVSNNCQGRDPPVVICPRPVERCCEGLLMASWVRVVFSSAIVTVVISEEQSAERGDL